jgi:hypothetical protein
VVVILVDPQWHTEIHSHLGPKRLLRSSIDGRGAGRPSATPYDLVPLTKDSGKKKEQELSNIRVNCVLFIFLCVRLLCPAYCMRFKAALIICQLNQSITPIKSIKLSNSSFQSSQFMHFES